MKTIKNLLFVAFAAMTIAACQKEFENPEGGVKNSGKVVTFTGSLDQVDTKTMIYYEDELSRNEFTTRIVNRDSIVVNGVSSGPITKVEGTVSKFSFSVQGIESPYFAVSAVHMRDGSKYEDGQYTILYSGSQSYRRVNGAQSTTYGDNADILAAYSENETMTFKHLTTFLAITIDKENSTDATNTKSVYVRQGDGSSIAGNWIVKYNDGNPSIEPGVLSNYITYNCDNTYASGGVPQGNVMIIGVPSYDYENGLLVTIEDMNGKFASFKVNEAKYASQAGVIIPFNPPFKPESKRTIKSADDWNEFAAHINATKGNAYQWIGGGAVVLEEDIEVESLTPITAEFKYVFDGNGKTITQTNATKPLFSNVSGEIKNLTLKGSLDLGNTSGAPLVNELATGGKISKCTNEMTVVCNRTGHTYVSGLVSYMKGGTIENCTNKGTVDVVVLEGTQLFNIAVAGIVADIRITDKGSVVLTDCLNSAALTLKSEIKSKITATSNTTKGMLLCGLGGIAGWLRNEATYTFTNCDNAGSVIFDASLIKQANGGAARTVAVGGLLGLAAPCMDGYMLPDFEKAYKLTLTECDNSGLVYNQGVNYSARGETNNKVFTGGLAGALAGVQSTHAQVVSCSNTGKVITHDFVSEQEGVTPSARPNYCCVAGGLVGYGAFLDMDDVTVKCQIGNGKRQMAAWGGVIGFAIKKFSLKNSDVDVSGHFASYPGYDANRAVVAVVPVQDGAKTSNLVPNVAGSEISNNTIKCLLHTFLLPNSQDSEGSMKTSDLSNEQYVTTISTAVEITSNLVCGEGFTANSGITIGEDTTGDGITDNDNNTYIAGTAN